MNDKRERVSVGSVLLEVSTNRTLEVRAIAPPTYCLVDPEVYDEKNGAEGMYFVKEWEVLDRYKYRLMRTGFESEPHPQLFLL